MSSIAGWSYANTARVRPFLGENGETGAIEYGPEYEIACTWVAEAKEYRQPASPAGFGSEFISAYVIYTEDARPQHLDQILLNSPGLGWQEIRARLEWDMSMFGDTPDYKLVT